MEHYFSDIKFIAVSHAVLDRDGAISHNPQGYWGIGMMLGSGCVRLIKPDREFILKMPFVYLCHPGGAGGWGIVDGARRENLWFIISGERAARMVNALMTFCTGETPTFCIEHMQNLISIHQRMLNLFSRGLPMNSSQLAICAEEFMGAIYDSMAREKYASRVFRLISAVLSQTGELPCCDFDFPAIARKNHISFDHFRRCFRQIPI